MSCVRDRLELRTGNHSLESLPSLNVQPLICLTPQNQRRAANTRILGFDLVGVATIKLRNLLIKRRLPDLTYPWPNVFGHVLISHRAGVSTSNIRTDHSLMNRRRQGAKYIHVGPYLARKLRTPGRECYRINEGEAP